MARASSPASPRRHPVRVQPFFGFRNAERLHLSARALHSREPVFEKRSFWRDLATMVGQYLSKNVPDLDVELEYTTGNGTLLRESAQTGPNGFARFELALPEGTSQPERTRWEHAILRWTLPDGSAAEAQAWILAPGTRTRNGVISDIDDTILETGITGSFRMIARNWKRVMAQMPSERDHVPGAPAFYAAIGGNPAGSREPSEAIDALAPQARVRPVFYVSSSPWNLFSYLVTFKRERGLPLGPVMLRDWGFNRRTLGGHGDHKREAMERIVTTYPGLRFALIGDDTQEDLVAFGAIAAKYPGRIAAVFIRSVSGEPLNDHERHGLDIIRKAGVPYWSGNDYQTASEFLASAGLDFAGGVDQLVRAASERDAPEPAPADGKAA